MFAVLAGAEVTFQNGTIAKASNGYGLQVVGTVNFNATYTTTGTGSGLFDCYDGAEINVGATADLESGADIFRSKSVDDAVASVVEVNIAGGTFKAAQEQSGDSDGSYATFYNTKNLKFVVSIAAGTFDCEPRGMFYTSGANAKYEMTLDDNCKAKFDTTKHLADFVAEGYELVKGADEYYTIAKIPTFEVAAISVDNATVVATNTVTEEGLTLPATVLRDTEIAVTVTPAADYEYATTPAGWTKNENGSITTNATVTADLAITVEAPTAAAAPWPVIPEFPADADDEVKGKYADWAKTYGVTDPAGTSDAFLMNDDPKAGTVTALEITSIEVADGVATIKVAAGEKNLETGINGKLFVSATDDLAGEWKTIVVEEPDSFENEGKTAVFEVEGAQFMKAKVDFTVETPADK